MATSATALARRAMATLATTLSTALAAVDLGNLFPAATRPSHRQDSQDDRDTAKVNVAGTDVVWGDAGRYYLSF